MLHTQSSKLPLHTPAKNQDSGAEKKNFTLDTGKDSKAGSKSSEQTQTPSELENQKFECMHTMAGGIAHRYNNLLCALMGNLELALERIPCNSLAYTRIKRAEKVAKIAVDLTGEIITCFGNGRVVLHNQSINQCILNTAESLFQDQNWQNIPLELKLKSGIPGILTNKQQLSQVIRHLVTNACEALDRVDARVIVSTGIMTCSSQYLMLSRTRVKPAPGKFVWMQVKDFGTGMDKETLLRAFDPFFSTKFIGRGLGLAMVLGIVEGHMGAVIAHSTPGRGSCFRILFPVANTLKGSRE